MADTLKLDVIVDDHGGVKTLQDVDAGVNKVKGSADQAKGPLGELSGTFAGLSGNMRMAIGAAAGFTILQTAAAYIRSMADEAHRFSLIATTLGDVSARQVQQLSVAGKEFGVSVETMATAMGRFRARLADGDLDGELQKLGINLGHFKDLNAAEQLFELGRAIEGIEDPTKRAAAAAALLRGDADQMRTVLTSAFQESANSATAMSTQTINDLKDVNISIDRTIAKAKMLAFELAMATGRGMTAPGQMLNVALNGPGALPGTPSSPKDLPGLLGIGGPDPNDPRAMALANSDLALQLVIKKRAQEENTVAEREATEQAEFLRVKAVELGGTYRLLGDYIGFVRDEYIEAMIAASDFQQAQAKTVAAEGNQLFGEMFGPKTDSTDKNAQLNAILDRRDKALAGVNQELAGADELMSGILFKSALEVDKLSLGFDEVVKNTDRATAAAAALGQTYQSAFTVKSGGYSPNMLDGRGGSSAPGRIPLLSDGPIANERYFGAVTPYGTPAPGGGGGSMITPQITVNAQGAFLDTPQNIDRLAKMVLDAAMKNGSLQKKF